MRRSVTTKKFNIHLNIQSGLASNGFMSLTGKLYDSHLNVWERISKFDIFHVKTVMIPQWYLKHLAAVIQRSTLEYYDDSTLNACDCGLSTLLNANQRPWIGKIHVLLISCVQLWVFWKNLCLNRLCFHSPHSTFKSSNIMPFTAVKITRFWTHPDKMWL